jgi:hypothetical protein
MSCTLGNEFPRIVIIITSLLEEKGDGGWVTFSYADIMNQLIADAANAEAQREPSATLPSHVLLNWRRLSRQ